MMWPFDQNNQQMYQQYANHWDQGTYGQIPEQEARQNYQQFIQNAPPQMVEQAQQLVQLANTAILPSIVQQLIQQRQRKTMLRSNTR